MKQKMIKLYKVYAAAHHKGSMFAPFDERLTEWSDNKEAQIELYNSSSIEHYDQYELQEMKYYNSDRKYNELKDATDLFFIWVCLNEIEVPLKEWNKAVKTDDYEMLPYLVDYNFTDIAERGIYLSGKNMSEKVFNSIIYEPYKATNKPEEGTGVFKSENIIYGKIQCEPAAA
jgi:hypothetical protein